ncbi:MAG: flavin reductase family protein [Candidatus Peribacteraceae bacterium]|nr:flavin reductase family protein [Candidatus Peribacteraceae bacterium]
MKPRSLPLSRVYKLLEPGPVVMVSTARGGKQNVMTMAWHTPLEFDPPLIGCVVSENNFSFKALKATKECVIAIPTVSIAETVVRVGNVSGEKTDKFKKFGLTPLPASKVSAPLIGECFANLECKIVDTTLVKKYNFFVLEVVKAWIDPAQKNPRTIHHRGGGMFTVDGETIRIASGKK